MASQQESRRAWLGHVGLFLGSALIVLAAVVAMAITSNRPPAHLTRDPLAVVQERFYVGALSNFGIVLWTAAATVCLFGAHLLSRNGAQPEKTRFFLSMGLLTAVLMLDDLYMVHEQFLPEYLGIDEKVVLATYAAVLVALFVAFLPLMRRTNMLMLGMSLGLFGISVMVDILSGDQGWRPVIEDAFKFLGIAAWLGYFSITAAHWLPSDRSA